MQSFLFGGNTGVSYDGLQRRRQIAQSLMQQKEAPKYAITGAADAAQSIVGALLDRKLEGQEKEMREGFNADFANALGGGFGGGVTGSAAAPAPVPQGEMAAKVRAGLIERGLPEHIADGFVMNFEDESNLNPGINEIEPLVPGSRGGFGLSQWTGPRRKELEAFAAQRGKPVSDMDTQLDFLMTELQGSEKAAAAKIMAAQDSGSAAAAIVNHFLRPAEEHRARREASYLGGSGVQKVASQANLAQLVQLADSPMATEGQKAVVSAILNRQMQASDPMHHLQMQNLQSQIDARSAPKPGYTQKTGAELGLTGEQAGMLFNVGPDNKITQIGGGGTNVSTTVNTGDPIDARPMADKPSKDYQRRWDEENKTWIDEPIPGTDASREIEDAASKKDERARQQTIKMGTTLTNIHMNIDEIQNGGMPVTGLIGALGGRVPGTAQADWRARNEQITTSAALAEVQNMRDNSPTGGAVGQLTDSEREAIALAASGISNAQSKGEYVRAAENYRKVMLDTAYGEDTWRLDPETGAVSVTAGELAGIEGTEVADFGEATLHDLLEADISAMTSEQMDAWEKRMKELQGGR